MKISKNLEVYEHRTKRCLVKTGGSLSITLPLEWLKLQGLKKGSQVLTVFDGKEPLKIIPLVSERERRRRQKGVIQVKTHLTKSQVEDIIKKFEKADKKSSMPRKDRHKRKLAHSDKEASTPRLPPSERGAEGLTQLREGAGEQK